MGSPKIKLKYDNVIVRCALCIVALIKKMCYNIFIKPVKECIMKRKLILCLCLTLCVTVCLACPNKDYWGVYKEQVTGGGISTGDSWFLELKMGGNCEYYFKKRDEKKTDISAQINYGTYTISEKIITLRINMKGAFGTDLEEWDGTILFNGRISWWSSDGLTERVFKIQ